MTRLAVVLVPFSKALTPKDNVPLRFLGQLPELVKVRDDAIAQFRRLFGRGPGETLKVDVMWQTVLDIR